MIRIRICIAPVMPLFAVFADGKRHMEGNHRRACCVLARIGWNKTEAYAVKALRDTALFERPADGMIKEGAGAERAVENDILWIDDHDRAEQRGCGGFSRAGKHRLTACAARQPVSSAEQALINCVSGTQSAERYLYSMSVSADAAKQMGYMRINGSEYWPDQKELWYNLSKMSSSDMVLLLAAQQDMEGSDLPEGKVTAFYFPKGTVIEVYATTLHFCPCEVSEDGFRCIVILPRGTNHPLRNGRPEGGDGRLLWAQDKWLICHPENEPVIACGAYPGLHGENFTVKY